jgi:hypothetical protein
MRVARLLAQCFEFYWPDGQSWDSRTHLLRVGFVKFSATAFCAQLQAFSLCQALTCTWLAARTFMRAA